MKPKVRWVQLPPKDPPPPPSRPPMPEYIPEGRYLLEVEEVIERISQWDNEYLQVKCKVIHPAIHPEFRISLVLSLTESALWKMREFLCAIWNEPLEGKVCINPESWISMRFYADVRIEYFRGKARNAVGSVYPAYPVERRDY